MSALGVATTMPDREVCGPTETECQPSEDVAEESDAEDAGFDDRETEVTGDAVKIANFVAQWGEDAKEDPEDEGDDGPVASWVRWTERRERSIAGGWRSDCGHGDETV